MRKKFVNISQKICEFAFLLAGLYVLFSIVLYFEMDCMASLHSPESLLVDLGLRAKGDDFSLKAFCKRRLGQISDESSPTADIEKTEA